MSEAGRCPIFVPYGADQTVYVIVDRIGCGGAYRDVEFERSDLEMIIGELLSAQFNDPVRIVAFNTLEHWFADLSADVAAEVRMRCDIDGEPLPDYIMDFVERYTRSAHSRTPAAGLTGTISRQGDPSGGSVLARPEAAATPSVRWPKKLAARPRGILGGLT